MLLTVATVDVSAQPATPAPGFAVADRNLRLRAQPTTASRAVSSVPEGYRVLLGLCARGWCEVRYLGVRGYAPERYLRPERLPTIRPRRTADRPTAPTTDTASAGDREAAPASEADAETRDPVPGVERAQVRPPTGVASATRSPGDLIAEAFPPEEPLPPDDPQASTADEPPTDDPAPSSSPTPAPPADPAGLPTTTDAARQPSDAAEQMEEEDATDTPVAANQPADEPAEEPPPPEPRVCPDLMMQAEEHYYTGDLDAAVRLASNCLMAGVPTTDEAQTAYQLLAQAHAELDRDGEARIALLQLLALDPTYEPERRYFDLAYTILVSDVKRQLGLPAPYRCDAELAVAYERYVERDGEGALVLAQQCLAKSDLVEAEAVEAHRLVALTRLQQNDLAAAREAVVALIERAPDYTADPVWDIPAYVALVNLVRQQRDAAPREP